MRDPFKYRHETRYWSDGTPTTLLTREMRVWDEYRHTVVYLYRSGDEAGQGVKAGGSGFVVGIPTDDGNRQFTYVVTCKHVVKPGARTVCLNTKEGKRKWMETEEEHWFFAEEDDLAVLPLGLSDEFRITSISPKAFVTQEDLEVTDVGVGDEVFMFGRFIHHEGTDLILPAARFGNIAMMDDEPIPHEKYDKQDSILVEMRSINGYSGSPVFVVKPIWSPSFVGGPNKSQVEMVYSREHSDALLGVDWGHLPFQVPALDENGKRIEGKYQKEVSSMSCVVPAWKILDLLNIDELTWLRAMANKQIEEETRPHEGDVVLDSLAESDFMPGLQRTLTRKLKDGALEWVDDDTFRDAMRRAVPPEIPPEQDDGSS